MTVVYLALALVAVLLLVAALRKRGTRDATPPVTRLGTLAEIKEEGWRQKHASGLAGPDEVAAAAGAPDPVPAPVESEPDD